MTSSAAKTQRAVVIACAAAQALTLSIKTHQGQQDQIQIVCKGVGMTRRFENSVSVTPQLWCRAGEGHPLCPSVGDPWEVGDTTASTQHVDERRSIEFTADA